MEAIYCTISGEFIEKGNTICRSGISRRFLEIQRRYIKLQDPQSRDWVYITRAQLVADYPHLQIWK